MIKLKDVSKIYSSNGVISTGFSKVSLEFDVGEFVAITGESGSGKSTLLNVLSGLDSYEEGEMYVMGRATSGFTREETENYRKEYISTIFQTFNLINSYTVYQNIELALLMSGCKGSQVRGRVKSIIEQVGLTKYEKTKVSKLSGGQKQRVAIGRALAKETPVIVADEPTGNLDRRAAEEIIRLLHDISKDKLIIIVTHNYEQAAPYVTRKIRMHDGSVIEDKRFKDTAGGGGAPLPEIEKAKAGSLSFGSMCRLSVRNTFNLPAKFLLLLAVFLFLCAGVSASYTATVNTQRKVSSEGYNWMFSDNRAERLLINKKDRSLITDEDYAAIEKIPNVWEIVRRDYFLDNFLTMVDGNADDEYNSGICIQVKIAPASSARFRLKQGRAPENEREAVLMIRNEDMSYVVDMIDKVMASEIGLTDMNADYVNLLKNLKITGYGFLDKDGEEENPGMYYEGILYLSDEVIEEINISVLKRYCSQEIEFAGRILSVNPIYGPFSLYASDKVPEGEIYIPEEIDCWTEKKTVGMPFTIRTENIYFKDSSGFTVGAVYKKNNLKRLLGLKDFDMINGRLFINPADYDKLYDKGNYQSSVIVKDAGLRDATAKKIEEKGFRVFKVSEGSKPYDPVGIRLNKIFSTVVLVFVVTVLFFINYFILKLILKSRNIYFSIIRMLGATKKNCASMLRTELFVVFNIAFLICAGFIGLVREGVIDAGYISEMTSVLRASDYTVLYAALCLISILLAGRYARRMFKQAAMEVFREM